MKKLCSWITEHTDLVLVVFLILTVVCAALKPLIGVNYDMNDYLPPDSASTVARDTLYDGLGDLDDGAAELVSGLGDLKDGSEEMKDAPPSSRIRPATSMTRSRIRSTSSSTA